MSFALGLALGRRCRTPSAGISPASCRRSAPCSEQNHGSARYGSSRPSSVRAALQAWSLTFRKDSSHGRWALPAAASNCGRSSRVSSTSVFRWSSGAAAEAAGRGLLVQRSVGTGNKCR